MKQNITILILLAAFCTACSGNNEKNVVQQAECAGQPDDTRQFTHKEPAKLLVSKGLVRSENEVGIYCRIDGQLIDFKLLEGQRVSKGQVLFRLDDIDLKARVQLSRSNVEQASVRRNEILIGQGYKLDKLDDVPENTIKYASIKSGLNVAETELDINSARLSRAVITAPQSGLITGIATLPFSYVKAGEKLCSIVDPDHLIVEFSILETELKRFSLGKEIFISSIAYSDIQHTATIRSIGTVVNESGMIKVEATIHDPSILMPGMTTIVRLQQQ